MFAKIVVTLLVAIKAAKQEHLFFAIENALLFLIQL
jgi:hypothetical protein